MSEKSKTLELAGRINEQIRESGVTEDEARRAITIAQALIPETVQEGKK